MDSITEKEPVVSSNLSAESFALSAFLCIFADMKEVENKLNINQWAEEDRPREKLERLGAQALSDAELLAILVGSGSTKEDAVTLMKRILNDCHNNLNTLGKMSIRDLCQYNGVGPAKAITILPSCSQNSRSICRSKLLIPNFCSIYLKLYHVIFVVLTEVYALKSFCILYTPLDSAEYRTTFLVLIRLANLQIIM